MRWRSDEDHQTVLRPNQWVLVAFLATCPTAIVFFPKRSSGPAPESGDMNPSRRTRPLTVEGFQPLALVAPQP